MNIQDLKKIWNNKSQIVEGFKNSIIKDEFVESVAAIRNEKCLACTFYDKEGTKCIVPGTGPCCGDCGCSLHLKQRSLSAGCGQGFWESILDDNEEI
jgi:hypothetical protein